MTRTTSHRTTNVLGLIPARGGSKGVERKNIRLLGKRPLIAWSIDAARHAHRLSSIVVSTDDVEIAEIAVKWGARVPNLRPASLAEDTTPTLPVIAHTLEQLAGLGEEYDAVCLLQPTSPFRTSQDIDLAVEAFEEHQATGLVSVRRIPTEQHPYWALIRSNEGQVHWATGSTEPPPRRQDLPAAFHRDGAVYVTRCDVIAAGSLYGDRLAALELDNQRVSINIDTPEDWRAAEAALRPEER